MNAGYAGKTEISRERMPYLSACVHDKTLYKSTFTLTLPSLTRLTVTHTHIKLHQLLISSCSAFVWTETSKKSTENYEHLSHVQSLFERFFFRIRPLNMSEASIRAEVREAETRVQKRAPLPTN